MRKTKLLILLTLLAGGCAQTVSPEKFLFLYRRCASPGHMEEGGYSQYTGKDGEYQYLTVQTSTAGHGAEQMLKYGAVRDETFRCPAALLPEDFPAGFHQLYEDGKRFETEEETYQYIRDYLGRSPAPSPPRPGPPTTGAPVR